LMLLARIDFADIFGLVPRLVWSKFFLWQLITYMFLHGGFWHILMNMFVLWMFGSDLERDWGSREFLKYYFLCGVGAGVFNVIFQPNSLIPIVGASGAIYGLLVAFAIMYPNRTVYLYFLFPVQVKYLVIFLAALEFFLSMTSSQSTVAHFAHLGGMLVGFLYLKTNWRYSAIKSKITGRFHQRKIEKYWKEKEKEQKMMEEVDQILDKINKVGYDNLTRQEKKILEDASNKLSKK
jgi:membrane associated rhomboid family serine protease